MLPEVTFKDHFAPVASNYLAFRPTYPPALFAWLATLTPQKRLAWDCACGSGQATAGLAEYFERVIGTDASASQISAAPAQPRAEYRVAEAGASGLDAGSVDLVTVAQALHWFDLEAFYREVRRVLCPGGVVAVWSYGFWDVEGDDVNSLVRRFYTDTVGPYWPPERRDVENGYANLAFPFTTIEAPTFTMSASWSVAELCGFLRSWSATGRYIKENGNDPVEMLTPALLERWGPPESKRRVTWPLTLRVGRI